MLTLWGAFVSVGCSSNSGNNGCSSGVKCGTVCCPDATHYACVSGQCVLTSCDQGLQLCGSGCIPVTANCCNQSTGTHCQTGTVCCAGGCIPIGTSCCSDGTYCPVGKVCCNSGQCC